MASYNIVHQHGHGFEHEIGNISVPWLALDNIGEVSKKHDKKSSNLLHFRKFQSVEFLVAENSAIGDFPAKIAEFLV